MQCFIYKSTKKQELYLYIAKQDDFSNVPVAVLNSIGAPVFVMELELTPDRSLAREKTTDVIKGIEENGFFIQLPAAIHPLPENLH